MTPVTPVPPLSKTAWRLAAAPFVIWALGSVFGEALQQIGMYACLLVALIFWKRISLAQDTKRYALAGFAFTLWQAVSPLISLLMGTSEHWPKSGRYSQFADTLAPVLGTLAGHVALPLTAMTVTLVIGWVTSVWLGAFQHFVEWPFGQPFWSHVPEARLHENFAPEGTPRFGAGGWLIHRLRFAHGSIAMLGPALSNIVNANPRIRWVAVTVTLHLMAAPVLGFTRAALIVGVSMLVMFTLAQLKGRVRLVLIGVAAVGLLVSFSSESWRQRVTSGIQNISGGERTIAMTAGLQLIKAHPLLGVGFGNHKSAAWATHEGTELTEYLATDSHNLVLTVWAETGLIGVVLLLLMHALLAKALWARAKIGNAWATGALLSWLGFHALCLVHYLPYHSGVHLSFALVWAVGLSAADDRALSLPSLSTS